MVGRYFSQMERDIIADEAELKADIAKWKAEVRTSIALMNEEAESLRRETESMIKESQAASERLAIEYQLKYKHSEESMSLRKPERTTAPLE